MIRLLLRATLFFVLLLLPQGGAADDSATDTARAFFEHYVRLEHAFDPKIADLYADEARIVSTRKYPSGLPDRTVEMPAVQYKSLIRKMMGVARARGDISRYSEISYSPEGERVRIRCTRFSELKRYSSPYSLLVGPAHNGEWLILEEISETRP